MAVPTSYSEANFKTYLHGLLGEFATVLDWSVAGGDYNEAINDALYLYGETDIANISGAEDTRKLRLLGRVVVWRRALQQATAYYDYRDQAGASYSRSQLVAGAKANLQQAELDAMAAGHLTTYQVGTVRIRHRHDPYGEADYDERPLTPQ